MELKFIKPTLFKISVFAFISIILLYFSKESVSAAGFGFAFFYESAGFPFAYLIKGDIGSASGHIKTLFLGDYFMKSGNLLFNPLTFIMDIFLIYLLACLLALSFKVKK